MAMRTGVSVTGERWREVNRLLDLALDRAPGERADILDRECAGDARLRAVVDRMLRACDDSKGFLEDEPAPVFASPIVAASLASDREQTSRSVEGLRVGPYRVVREAGHGGMGVVYLAERADDQYQHRVALKLLRGGAAAMADEHLARRFLEERRSSRRSSIPSIARLLDGGVTETAALVRDGVRRGHADRPLLRHARPPIDERLDALLRRVRRGRSSRIGTSSSTATSSPRTSWSPTAAR